MLDKRGREGLRVEKEEKVRFKRLEKKEVRFKGQ